MIITRGVDEFESAIGFIADADFTAGAGQFTGLQLFNPAGSAVVLVVRRIFVSTSGSHIPRLMSATVALGTLVGNGFNLRLGGAISVAEIRTESMAAEAGTRLALMRVSATTANEFLQHEQIIIPAGRGLTVIQNVAAANMSAFFVWKERAE